MTDVVVEGVDVIVETPQPVVPPYAPPVKIGLVEINQVVQRGTAWLTGSGPPTAPGGQYGDMYLDVDTGDIYQWDGSTWVLEGTFAPATDTPQEVLDKLIQVDGAGSTLDADLLDSHDSTYFATQSDMTTAENNIASNTTAINTNTTNIAQNAGLITDLQANKANIASPVLTGDPRAPTPATADNDTSIATTAFVKAQGYLTPGTGVTSVTGTAPVVSSGGTTPAISMPPATTSANGYLTSANWNTFNAKVPEAPTDGIQYVRQSSGWAPVSVPPGTYVGDTPPASPSDNQMWWESDSGILWIYYNDGTSKQWTQVAGPGTNYAASYIGDGPPAQPYVGQTWWESDTGNYYVYFDDQTSKQWVQVNGVGNAAFGVTDGSNAAAGMVGEIVVANGTSTSIANGTPTNVSSAALTLQPGDWDVWGWAFFTFPSPATQLQAAISSTSAVMPSQNMAIITMSTATLASSAVTVPTIRVNNTSPTTVYLVGQIAGATGSPTVTGIVYARRRR